MGSCLSLNHCLLPLTLIVLGIHGTVRDREGEGAWNGWRMKVTRVQPILTSVTVWTQLHLNSYTRDLLSFSRSSRFIMVFFVF